MKTQKETKNLFSIYVEVSNILQNKCLKEETNPQNSLMLKSIITELCEFYKESNGVLDKLLLEVNSLPKVQDYLQKTQNLTEACISILRAFSLENEQRPPHIIGVHIKNAIIKLSVVEF